MGVVLAKELLFLLVLKPMLLIETLKSFLCILISIFLMVNLIVVGSSVLIGKDIIGLIHIIELGFSLFPICFVLVGMVLG